MRKARLSRMTFTQTMHRRRKEAKDHMAQKLRPGWRGAFGPLSCSLGCKDGSAF